MAHRHMMHKRARGGRAGDPFRHNYSAPGSTRIAEEAEKGTDGFKRGGHKHHAGHAHGGRAKAKAGFKRGGGVWSHAHHGISGPKGFAPPPHHDSGRGGHDHGVKYDKGAQVGSSRKGIKGKAPHQNASDKGYRKVTSSPLVKGHKDGGVVKKATGGSVEPTPTRKQGGAVAKKHGGECEPDGEEDEPAAAKRGGRMHYFGGKGRHKAQGGHVDLYVTKGGTHHWQDDDHHRRHGGKS